MEKLEKLKEFFDVNPDGPYIVLSDKGKEKQCLVISFRDNGNTIFIHDLDKCGFSGTESLNILYDFAKENPDIKTIELADGSVISQCGSSISLSILKILTTGKSWYNSLGYKSVNYDAEVEHNARIIEMEFKEFLNLCIDKQAEKYEKLIIYFDYDTFEKNKSIYQPEYVTKIETNKNLKDNPEALTAKIQEFKKTNFEKYMNLEKWEGTNPEMPVRVFFNIINDKLKIDKSNNSCDAGDYEWLREFIYFIKYSEVLLYSGSLIKQVIHEVDKKEGGRRKKGANPKSATAKKAEESIRQGTIGNNYVRDIREPYFTKASALA